MITSLSLLLLLNFVNAATPHTLCEGELSPRLTIYGEFHDSPEAMALMAAKKAEAAAGKAIVLFEAVPRAANSIPALKNEFLKAMRIPVQLTTLKNIHGIDSELHQFMDTIGANYLLMSKGHFDEHFFFALHELLIRKRLKSSLNTKTLSEPTRNLLRISNFERLMDELIRLQRFERPVLLGILSDLHKAGAERLRDQGEAFLDVNLTDFSGNSDDFIGQSIDFRDRYMAESIKQIAERQESRLPIDVLIGKFHAPGVLKHLRQLMPQRTIHGVDVESGEAL